MAAERLQKVLARLGLGSRRDIEQWIREGRIAVNGEIAQLGVTVQGDENVTVNGKPVTLSTQIERRILQYFKPDNQVCTVRDPQGRATVFDDLPAPENGKWISVGRLDLTTTGLLLFTNDGVLANRLMHPSAQIEREYVVRTLGKVTETIIERLSDGVRLEDGVARFKEIVDLGGKGANHWYRVVLMEGRNHEVKRLWESQGIRVSRLKRVRFGSVTLDQSLSPGQYRLLHAAEQNSLVQKIKSRQK